MSLQEFQQAQRITQGFRRRPTDEELLALYGWFKQAQFGDAAGGRPGFWDPKGRRKWDAWHRVRGTPAQEARQKYVEYVKQLQGRYA